MSLDTVIEWIGGALVLVGSLFVLIGAVGIIRMPDVLTRLHAASVVDSLGGGMILVGLILFAGLSLVAVKLFFLLIFFGLLNPVAVHAVARSALHAGYKPMLAEDIDPESIAEEPPKSKH